MPTRRQWGGGLLLLVHITYEFDSVRKKMNTPCDLYELNLR